MDKEVTVQQYDFTGGHVEVLYVSASDMYEVWEHISDAYGVDQYLRKRTRIYPDADALALDIARSHDDLTGGA